MPNLIKENLEITRLLDQLMVVSNNDTKRNRILTKFYELNSHRDAKDIIKELQQSLAIAEQAKQEALSFIKSHGLRCLTSPNGKPAFEYSWDEHFMCPVIKLRIAGVQKKKQDEHYMSYEGRTIEIKIATTTSNNDLNPDDMRHVFESKYAAALALADNKEISKLENLKNKFVAERENLLKKFYDNNLKITIKHNVALQQKFIVELAVMLIKIEKGNNDYHPSKSEIKKKITQLRDKENILISNAPRDIKINCYPQHASDTEQTWIINANYPQSDMSAAERSLSSKMISNWWHVVNKAFTFDQANTIKKEVVTDEFDRSSSLAQAIAENPANKAELELISIRNVIKQKAREQIIKKLNEGGDITNNILIKLAAVTLLSPVGSKQNRRLLAKFIKPLKPTLIDGNEQEQLESMKNAFNKINDEELEFSDNDIKYIIAHVDPTKITAASLLSKLRNIKIKPKTHYLNFPVNKIGPIAMESFDIHGYNRRYNLEGMNRLQKNIIEYIQDPINNTDKNDIDNLTEIFENEITRQNWLQIRHKLNQYKQSNLPENLKNIIADYIDIQDHLCKMAKTKNSRISNAYIVAAKACHLNSLLNVESFITCKSGKDRTGFLTIIKEALIKGHEYLINNIYRSIKLGSSKDLNQKNTPGGRGLQVEHNILDSLFEFFGIKLKGLPKIIGQLIKSQNSRLVGGIPKAVYKCDAAIAKHLKDHPHNTKKSTRFGIWHKVSPRKHSIVEITANGNDYAFDNMKKAFESVKNELNKPIKYRAFKSSSKYSVKSQPKLGRQALLGPETDIAAIKKPGSDSVILSFQYTQQNIQAFKKITDKVKAADPNLEYTLTSWPDDVTPIAKLLSEVSTIKLPKELFDFFDNKFIRFPRDEQQYEIWKKLSKDYLNTHASNPTPLTSH